MARFDGKVVVVTGSASGIGEHTARRIAVEGGSVVIADINGDAAENVADQIRGVGGAALAVLTDVAVEAEVAAMIEAAVKEFGGLDGLYNNAAAIGADNIGRDTTVVDIPLEVWDNTLQVNLTGYFFGIRHAVPRMLERGGGSIVNTIADAAYIGEPQRVAYAVSKAGIIALSRHTASCYGKRGIRSNCVSPGLILTPGEEEAIPQAVKESILNWVPSPRLGLPSDMAAVTTLLLSDEANFVNAQEISVNGGNNGGHGINEAPGASV
jgi:NAD(P)-dependent dehydrogenase (short-subunit alcohol dehydrogenase family)